jgi:pyrimidine-nucleoside phosphorylase
MSKKLASGADVICLDVKIGDGAFMKTIEDARELSRIMVSIGESLGKKVSAFITSMDQPLGYAVGNRLEVKEVIDTLNGHGPSDLEELCIEIAGYMVYYAKLVQSIDEGKAMAKDYLNNGKALKQFYTFIEAQGGHIDDLENFIQVKEVYPFKAKSSGYVKTIKALNIGLASMKIGGGRETKEDIIDPSVGIVLNKKIGDYVEEGQILANVYLNNPMSEDVLNDLNQAFEITKEKQEKTPIIKEIIN